MWVHDHISVIETEVIRAVLQQYPFNKNRVFTFVTYNNNSLDSQ